MNFTSSSTSRRALVAVVALAFALRLAYVHAHEHRLVSDEVDYDRLAWTLATTGGYTEDGAPTAYRPIGYPAAVAGVYAMAGRRPHAVHQLQAAVDAGSTLLLFHVAGGGVVGLWAAAIWAVFPPALLYTDLLMPECLLVLLLLLAAWMIRRGALTDRRGSLLLGALFGAIVLVKPCGLLVAALLPLAAARERIRPVRLGPLTLGLLLIVSPWLARNGARLGSPVLVTSVGANLLIGNNPHATGGYTAHVPVAMIPGEGTEARRDLIAAARAARYIVGDPAGFARTAVRKLAHLFGSEGGMLVWSFHPDPGDPSTRFREKYRAIPLGLHLLFSGGYGLVLLLGTVGLLGYPRGEVRAIFLALLGAWIAIHLLFYGGSRYHFPLMPFFALFAASLVSGASGLPRERPGRLALIGVVWALFLGVWAGEIATVMRP